MSPDHWMMFSTFAEQGYFEYPKHGTYKGVIINANMAAHAPAGLAAFLLGKTGPSTKYVIDPLTHAFQHDPAVISDSEGAPKASIASLASQYGNPIERHVGKRPLLPDDIDDQGNLEKFVERYMATSDLAKYLDDLSSELPPYALVAPYFFLTETTLDDWLHINARAAEIASVMAKDSKSKCFAAIVVNQGVLVSDHAREEIYRAFSKIPLDGYFLWIDDLNEKAASGAELASLLKLAFSLRAEGTREVINLHGGYFSVLAGGKLGRSALSGVAHAPEFGEHRGVVPVGGGIPISRYYIPNLHSRIRYRDALAIFRTKGWLESVELFHANVCDCEECKETLGGDPANFTKFGESTARSVRRRHGIVRIEFPTSDAKKRCLRHYLQRKHREYKAAAEAPKEVLLGDLIKGEETFLDAVGLEGIAHLRLWRKVFSGEIP
jgi:hypothetical protein